MSTTDLAVATIATAIDFEKIAATEVLTRSTQVVVVVDATMVVRWISPSASNYDIDALGRSIVDFVHPEDLHRVAQAFDAAVFEEDFEPSHMANSLVSMRLVTDSATVPFEVSGRWIQDAAGDSWLIAILNDVSTRYGTSQALTKLAVGATPRESAQAIIAAAHGYGGVRGAQMVSNNAGSIETYGDLGEQPAAIEQAWPGMAEFTGPTHVDPPASSDWCFAFPLRVADERLGTMVVWGVGKVPEIFFAGAVLQPLLDLASLSVVRSRELVELHRRATTDHVTGLLNRHAFFAALEQAVERTAVIYVDLDGFKAVNDKFGHTTGDHLLAEVSARLVAAVHEHDPVGRLGGDEFAIAHIGISQAQAEAAAERIRAALNQAMSIDGHRVQAGASVGVAYTAGAACGVELLDIADRALLQAKAQGKGRVVMLDSDTPPRAAG